LFSSSIHGITTKVTLISYPHLILIKMIRKIKILNKNIENFTKNESLHYENGTGEGNRG